MYVNNDFGNLPTYQQVEWHSSVDLDVSVLLLSRVAEEANVLAYNTIEMVPGYPLEWYFLDEFAVFVYRCTV